MCSITLMGSFDSEAGHVVTLKIHLNYSVILQINIFLSSEIKFQSRWLRLRWGCKDTLFRHFTIFILLDLFFVVVKRQIQLTYSSLSTTQTCSN